MGTLVISPMYEYANFKSSNSSTHKGQSLQGRKSPVNNHSRRNSTSSHSSKAISPPHNSIRQSDAPLSPSRSSQVESRNKLERAMSEPVDRIQQQQQQQQPSSSNSSRYKTELCRPFEESGTCKYGDKCQFAHGIKELRTLARHPKYKTELCRSFHTTGLCPYGPRCHFIHNEPTNMYASFSGGATGTTLPLGRPKALSSSSLGSAGDVSPPSSHSGSPTLMKTSENLFQFPSPAAASSVFSFQPHEYPSTLQRSGFLDYTTHEFNPDFYDTSNIFQERMLSSVFGSSDSGLDLESPPSVCGSPTLDLFPPRTPMSPTSPLMDVPFMSFPGFNLFGKQELN